MIAAGFVAGFINTVAGSGSAVSLPLLMFLGLPATVANATNRVAILLQCVVGARTYHGHGVLDGKGAVRLAIPAILGAVLGARIAVDLPDEVMQRIIGGLMVVMLAVILLRPKRWLEGRAETLEHGAGPLRMLLFFAIGVYGGFIQMGVGIFLLAGLVLGAGYELVRANAVKVVIVLAFTVPVLAVYAWNDQVDWTVGLVLACGNMLGAWAGAHLGVKLGAGFVRWVLILVVVFSAAKFLGLLELLGL